VRKLRSGEDGEISASEPEKSTLSGEMPVEQFMEGDECSVKEGSRSGEHHIVAITCTHRDGNYLRVVPEHM
jgi:hypothetical protein